MAQDIMFELETINSIVQLMNPLTPAERQRTIAWLAAYYGAAPTCAVAAAEGAPVDADAADADASADEAAEASDDAEADAEAAAEPVADDDFRSFAEFYDYVAPKTARQKVATAASWLEDDLEYDTWKTYDVTKLLKSIDRPLKFVSGTIFQEAKKADPLVAAVECDEEEKKFRGQYKLTEYGRAFIQGKFSE